MSESTGNPSDVSPIASVNYTCIRTTPKSSSTDFEIWLDAAPGALVEGASVARVARAHGVNANQVLHWRKLYLVGRLGSASGAERAGRDQAGTETVLGASSKIPTTPQRMRRFSFAYQMLGGSVGFLQRSAP